jgi:hypothetical protein
VLLNTSFSNMESVWLKIGNSLENKVLQVASIEIQVIFWKAHHPNSISWGFFYCEWWFSYGSWKFTNVKMYYLQI